MTATVRETFREDLRWLSLRAVFNQDRYFGGEYDDLEGVTGDDDDRPDEVRT
jgi:hypothetical protein